MNYLIKKFLKSLFSDGIVQTIKKVYKYFFHLSTWYKHQKVLELESTKDRFTEIYKLNLWTDNGLVSPSGKGSSLAYTKNLRLKLPGIFEKYEIQSILDVPCGDFNWMGEVLRENDHIQYLGGDIVEELVIKNQKEFSSEKISFKVIDITKDPLPESDLMIVRDCLFHLSYEDIFSFTSNLKKSNIKFLLTSTYIVDNNFQNSNIKTGDARPIDLFSEPFKFPQKYLEHIDDYIEPFPPRIMCLFKVKELR